MPDEKTGKIDLSGVTIHDAADKTLAEIVDEMEQRVAAVRERRDPALESTRGMFRFVPYALLNPVLQAISFCAYTLNLDLSRFGIPRDAFGSVMVTNVGSLGLDTAYVPLIPWSRVPMLIAVGAVRDAPVAEGGVVVVRKVLGLHATFDHRFIDGLHAAAMSRLVRDWLENPFERFGPLPPAPAPGGAGR
jgi:pyruvate dehydrogenase E2 component (dihydrolipoamide acetyltransferase)